MLVGFFARQWERTCAECGYTWRVPRSIARGAIRGSMGGNARAAKMSPRYGGDYRAGVEARADLMEGFRTCAKCGADDFTQRPVTRRG
jgi:hypothetical protein